MLPFSPGITGHCTEENDTLFLELRSLRNLQTVTFVTKDPTIINTIKEGYSPILEDYLGDNLPGFGDAFMEMQSHSMPTEGEERTFKIAKGVKMIFCWIPAGEAQLGLPENKKRYSDGAEHLFETQGFWMGKYTVTQTQWEAVMGKNPSHFKGANLPVENVSWNDCQDFIKKCSVSGLKLQLPHEDQWEYACRGGKGNQQPFYWGDNLNGDKANCNGNYPFEADREGAFLGKTTEVGSYEKLAPHPWNLCDMSGNVLEWCENLYGVGGLNRVLRGGCWYDYSGGCRSSARGRDFPTFRYSYLGFRLAVT